MAGVNNQMAESKMFVIERLPMRNRGVWLATFAQTQSEQEAHSSLKALSEIAFNDYYACPAANMLRFGRPEKLTEQEFFSWYPIAFNILNKMTIKQANIDLRDAWSKYEEMYNDQKKVPPMNWWKDMNEDDHLVWSYSFAKRSDEEGFYRALVADADVLLMRRSVANIYNNSNKPRVALYYTYYAESSYDVFSNWYKVECLILNYPFNEEECREYYHKDVVKARWDTA